MSLVCGFAAALSYIKQILSFLSDSGIRTKGPSRKASRVRGWSLPSVLGAQIARISGGKNAAGHAVSWRTPLRSGNLSSELLQDSAHRPVLNPYSPQASRELRLIGESYVVHDVLEKPKTALQ